VGASHDWAATGAALLRATADVEARRMAAMPSATSHTKPPRVAMLMTPVRAAGIVRT
jgi:hypothetical protein